MEVLDGLKAGDEVLGQGAILLKPFIVRALRAESSKPVSLREHDSEARQ